MPGCGGDSAVQHFGVGWPLGSGEVCLFFRSEILSEVLGDALRSELQKALCVGPELSDAWRRCATLAQLVDRSVVVGGEGGDVDQAGHLGVCARFRDDDAAVGVADEKDWAIFKGDRPFDGGDIVFK